MKGQVDDYEGRTEGHECMVLSHFLDPVSEVKVKIMLKLKLKLKFLSTVTGQGASLHQLLNCSSIYSEVVSICLVQLIEWSARMRVQLSLF